ncbi:CCR4-NOT transcription complex subunit 1 isoform X2 [Chrysoperla carnea]|uniref:CCR4-NOT transcription complex subunit 1 isoform X2 n=1 Tax=Chrysoperla carnea TaxID=189513 RepID=UPI001D075994|nr:CCR4-NOT transcription complex subunit 1 isoform X2 [Chrysoperla carnea]
MNLDSLSFTLSQISNLVANLNKKNYKQSSQELTELVAKHGLEADRHLLRCLFSYVDFGETVGPSNKGSTIPQTAQAQLLQEQCAALLNKPTLVSTLCFAFDNPLQTYKKGFKLGIQSFQQLSRILRLSAVQEVAIALALKHSSNSEIANCATVYVRNRLPPLVQSYLDTERSSSQQEGLHDTSPEILHLILSSAIEKSKELGISQETITEFIRSLQRDFPREHVPIVLAPLLYSSEAELSPTKMSTEGSISGGLMDSSLADIIAEMGYNFTSSLEECRNVLRSLTNREITPLSVACVISTMCRTNTSIEDGSGLGLQTPGAFWSGSSDQKDKQNQNAECRSNNWNVDIFVQALKEVAPNLSWTDVVIELDHPEFIIKDRAGLNLLFTTLRLGLQNNGFHPELFPVDSLYRHWKNIEGQFSLIQHILKNPDIFCFVDYHFHSVSVDVLKAPPESDNKEIGTWRSLNLVELLLHMSERGLYPQVQELFKFPVQNCPDVLVLALLQINPPITVLRQELLTNLIPIFLGNHPNSAIILHHTWHAQTINIKPIIMHAMAEWYVRGDHDQTRLSRILDVAQDLKALSMLLNAQSFAFVIDLACLASRREYLKLEKWLTDKIREHGESFVSACIKFLQRRCPQIMGGKSEDTQPKAAQLPHETLATMLNCLQVCITSGVSAECSDAILTMAANCSLLLSKTRQAPPGVIRTHRGIETPFNPSNIGGHLFNTQAVDPMAGLSSNLATLSIGGPSGSAFSLPGALGPLVSTPGSPSRIMAPGPSNSPFPLMPLQHTGPVGSGASLVSGVGGSLGRMAPTPGLDKPQRISDTNLFPEMAPNVSKEIEDEANSYFQRIYNHPPHPTLSIDEVLDMLKKFQESPSKREREVFNCMLRNLFEEYRFFPQYPDKELQITAQLFGGIIERGLVTSYMALGLALRFVLDALRKSEGSKMYYFGIAALDRFKSRLKDYHKYCEHVRAIQHFNEFPPHLIEYVEYGLQSMEPPNKPQGPVLPTSLANILAPTTTQTPPVYKSSLSTSTNVTTTTNNPVKSVAPGANLSSRPSIANATNIDTLLVATEKEEKVTVPPESLQDKTAFIFNNLSQLNLQSKCDELRELVTEEFWPWISQYLVMKRASIELNFHALYSNFLDVLKMPEVNKMVTKETFRNIKVLLRSDKGIANFSDRSLLKNLGHWLGMLTLGRNKPILQIDIDLKSLLVEAYHKGQQELLYVVPFVAKVLESCAKSKVFKPPNPWTMAIMNVLAELHQEPDLKLNLKFEIEVLCKNLNIDVTDLKPAIYLKDTNRLRMLEYQLSQPLKKVENQIMATTMATTVAEELPTVASSPSSSTSGPPAPTNSQQQGPPEPRFSYMDIHLPAATAVLTHLSINSSLALFQTHPQLKQLVRPAIERAIQEWLGLVVDRSIKIALTTCEQIVRKDFALDSDESRMRIAAHHMVRNLTAGMAMITCRDQLVTSISTNLKSALMSTLMGAAGPQKELVEQVAAVVAQENMELACAIIQKTAIEKAIPEIEKRLMNDFEIRQRSRAEGRRYCDPIALAYQAERMPEPIRLKVGGISPQQMTVYEEFARNIPGFLPISERDTSLFTPKVTSSVAAISQDQLGVVYDKLAEEVQQFLQACVGQAGLHGMAQNMHSLLECIICARRVRDVVSAMTLVQKAVEGLQDGLPQMNGEQPDPIVVRYRDIHVKVLRSMQDPRAYGIQWTNKHVTRCLTECREELRFNIEAVDTLIRAHLVNMPQLDLMLASSMDNGNNYMAVAFCMQLIQMYLVEERGNSVNTVTEADFFNVIEQLARIAAHSRQPPEGLTTLIEFIRQNHEQSGFMGDRAHGPTVHIHSGILQVRARDYDDPPGLMEKTDFLLKEWVNSYHLPTTGRDPTKAFSMFVHQMNVHGILKTDDLITRFFRLSTQICVEIVYRCMADQSIATGVVRTRCFHWLDAFVRLIALLVKHSGDSNNTNTKINLLNKVLGIVAGCLLTDHETHGTDFQQLPYHRIFIMLFLELNAPEPVLEAINFQVLTAFCHTLHILRPEKASGFCYAWLELVSHRVFIGRMLAITPQQKGWGIYSQLLIDLFKFLAPYLRNAELAKPVTLLYKGTLRVLLVLLHDFPEFLCDYHYGFCDVIPPNCIQMRNLILSAFPRNMRLPDPFTPNLKVDMLPEISLAPRVLTNFATLIQPVTFKKDLDSYLKARAPVTFLSELRGNLQVSNEPGMRYNIPLMNALVLYVGTQAISYIRGKSLTPSMSTIAHSAHMDIFQNLAVDLDTEGRYLFLNAIANQLRYPNSHTHYFSCTLLYLFAEANTECIQEQITRVLLERLIVNRPHPWGLLITFIELIKNPTYKFWNHEFVHCAQEIEKLFESVARSCMVQKAGVPPQEGELPE